MYLNIFLKLTSRSTRPVQTFKYIKNENDMSWQDVEKLELSYMRGGT